MRLRFWGTRGSLAKPGSATLRYGGNTSCVQVESDDGTLVVLDCGTGAHALGQELLARDGPVRGHVLISHTHWDHIQGLPFFTPLFVPGNEWDIYGPGGLGDSLQEALAGQMQYTYFPVTLQALGAEVRYHDLVEGHFSIGEISVRTRYLNHPALALAYRLEVDGVVVVYVCDHEPHSRDLAVEPGEITGQDREHAEFLRDADLVVHDAQYTASEYPDKIGWGHSTAEYATRICDSVDVKRMALTHHDPLHDDAELDRIVESLRRDLSESGSEMEVFAAAEGQVIELTREDGPSSETEPEDQSAIRSATGIANQTIVLHMADSVYSDRIREAVAADEARVVEGESVVELYREERPALVILDADAAGLAACQAIRGLGGEAGEVPVILVGERPLPEPEVTDWLVTPFSVEYARSRIRAWLLRVSCRWVRAPLRPDEPERLAAVQELDLEQSGAEERFDRITRLAAGLLGTPVSLVTVIEEERQWFKSRVGTDVSETPREAAFCEHNILDGEPMVVPDMLEDDRFADNPFVAGPPHVRFYAGCPVALPGGHPIGTLCVLDLRPRQLTEEQLGLLRDLADMVEEELAR